MVKTILLISFFIFLVLFQWRKKVILGRFLPKILAIDKVVFYYFITALVFAFAYWVGDILLFYLNDTNILTIYDDTNKSFGHPFDYLYFSLITQLTIGYGDINPKYELIRYLAALQGVLGAILVGGIIASIIQFSSFIKINRVHISEKVIDYTEPKLLFIVSLSTNPKSVYQDLTARVFFTNNGTEILLGRNEFKIFKKSNSISIECHYADINLGLIGTKGNKLTYNEIYYLEDSHGDGKQEEEYYEFDNIIIELTYSIGSNVYTYQSKIADVDKIIDIINSKTNKCIYDSDEIIELMYS